MPIRPAVLQGTFVTGIIGCWPIGCDCAADRAMPRLDSGTGGGIAAAELIWYPAFCLISPRTWGNIDLGRYIVDGGRLFSSCHPTSRASAPINIPHCSDMDGSGNTESLHNRGPPVQPAAHHKAWASEVRANANDWNAHRACIENLYRREGRSLPEVMQIMKDTCNIKAR